MSGRPKLFSKAWWAQSTFTDWVVAAFTMVLAGVGIIQGLVSYRQWTLGRDQLAITQRQLLDAETPQFGISFEGGGFLSNMALASIANIKNAGQITVFDAQVFTGSTAAPMASMADVWSKLELRDHVVLGPGEDAQYNVNYRPSAAEVPSLKSGALVVITGLKMQFKDGAGHWHERYTCKLWYTWNGKANSTVCPTPPQS